MKKDPTSRVYAFIDLSNVFRGAESEGWEMDYEKLHHYLTTRYGVTNAFVFGGTSNRSDRVLLHEQLVHLGYWVLEYLRTMKEHIWLFGISARTARDLKRLFQSDFSNISDLRGVLAVRKETQEAETTRISASPTTYPFDVYAVGVKPSYQNRSGVSSTTQAGVDNDIPSKETP